MRFNSSWPCLIVFLLFAHTATADTILLENEGVVVFEVASVPPAEGWTEKTELEGFLGASYYEWTGPDYFKGADAGNGTLTYTFRITNPGNYQLRWRNRIAQGELSTEHNDSWVRFATGVNVVDEQPVSGWTKVFMNQEGSWNWEARTKDHVADPVRQYLNAGDHTFEISGRSAGHAINRVVLYQYETINFSDGKFNTFPLSETSDVPGTPGGGDPAPDPEPDPEPEPDPNAMDWSIPDPLEIADTCEANTLALAPTADIYVQNNTVSDLPEVRIDGTNRKGLLQFDASLVPASKTEARLAFFTSDDDGDGTVYLYAGSHSNWTESGSTLADVPSASLELGSYTGVFGKNKRFALPFDVNLLSTDVETMLLEMTADSNDISILSSESESGPRLLISGGETFCDEFAQLLEQSQTPPDPEPAPIDPTPTDPVEGPETNTPPVVEKEADKDNEASSAGYLIMMALFVSLVWRQRRRLINKKQQSVLSR